MTDEELLNRFTSGEEAALGELAARYEPLLIGLAQGMLGGCDDLARDAVQETWMRVIRSSHTFRGKSSVKTWLYRIAINRCRTIREAVHRDAQRERGEAQLTSKQSQGEPAQPIDGETRASLREAIERLDAAKREVVLLCYHADLTHEQAAAMLEIPLGTLKSRLNAALTQLRSTLSPEVCT